MTMFVRINKQIIPNVITYKTSSIHKKYSTFLIDRLKEDCIIQSYFVELSDDEKIKSVILDSFHINCHPKTKKFCFNPLLKTLKFSRDVQSMIESDLKIFRYNDSYYKEKIIFEFIQKSDIKTDSLRSLHAPTLIKKETFKNGRIKY